MLNLRIWIGPRKCQKFHRFLSAGTPTVDICAWLIKAPRGLGVPQPGPQACSQPDSHFPCWPREIQGKMSKKAPFSPVCSNSCCLHSRLLELAGNLEHSCKVLPYWSLLIQAKQRNARTAKPEIDEFPGATAVKLGSSAVSPAPLLPMLKTYHESLSTLHCQCFCKRISLSLWFSSLWLFHYVFGMTARLYPKINNTSRFPPGKKYINSKFKDNIIQIVASLQSSTVFWSIIVIHLHVQWGSELLNMYKVNWR